MKLCLLLPLVVVMCHERLQFIKAQTEEFTATEGETFTAQCLSYFSANNKYFCRNDCNSEENILVWTADDRQQNGRYGTEVIKPNSYTLYVSITNVRRSDDGRYVCGWTMDRRCIQREFILKVISGNDHNTSSTLQSTTTALNISTTSQKNQSTELKASLKPEEESTSSTQHAVPLYAGVSLTAVVIILAVSLAILCWIKRTKRQTDSTVYCEIAESSRLYDEIPDQIRPAPVENSPSDSNTKSTNVLQIYSLVSAPREQEQVNHVYDEIPGSVDFTENVIYNRFLKPMTVSTPAPISTLQSTTTNKTTTTTSTRLHNSTTSQRIQQTVVPSNRTSLHNSDEERRPSTLYRTSSILTGNLMHVRWSCNKLQSYWNYTTPGFSATSRLLSIPLNFSHNNRPSVSDRRAYAASEERRTGLFISNAQTVPLYAGVSLTAIVILLAVSLLILCWIKRTKRRTEDPTAAVYCEIPENHRLYEEIPDQIRPAPVENCPPDSNRKSIKMLQTYSLISAPREQEQTNRVYEEIPVTVDFRENEIYNLFLPPSEQKQEKQ
ncbi:hypothetical protein WMY93_030680 [Mugilogobius chulae]|uniref:Ig-like domain-containing protein n=1 Tax=Mugilogobius chulae TaxID=88201 RepID=A0AAW0MMK7_9GOBI